MEVVYKYDLVQIGYDKENKLLRISWENYLTTEDFVRGLRALLQLTLELEIEKWLVDARASDELDTSKLKWPKDHIGKMMEQSKLKKIARVVSQNGSHETQIRTLHQYLENHFNLPCEIRYFESESVALDWLKNKTGEAANLTSKAIS